jgi:hypothetical protein
MKPFAARHDPLESCVAEIAQFRANLAMLEEELRQRRRRLVELESRMPRPGEPEDPARTREIEEHSRRIADLDVLHAQVLPELEALLHQCKESEAHRKEDKDGSGVREASLRAAIDDPRYWRDGDPVLSRFVSDGFKELYPGEADD